MSYLVEQNALALPPAERAKLADALMQSLEDPALQEREAAWGREADARLAAYENGELSARDGLAVMEELRRKHTQSQ